MIDRSFHQHGTCALCSSDWHVQPVLAFALCTAPPALQTWGQHMKTTEVLSGRKVMTPTFFIFMCFLEWDEAGLSGGVDRCSPLIINPNNIWPHSWMAKITGYVQKGAKRARLLIRNDFLDVVLVQFDQNSSKWIFAQFLNESMFLNCDSVIH